MPARPVLPKSAEELRRIVGDGPGRAHLERLLSERAEDEAARQRAAERVIANREGYPTEELARAAQALTESEAVARARFSRLLGLPGLRADAERGRKSLAGLKRGGTSRGKQLAKANGAEIVRLTRQWEVSDELQSQYRTANAYVCEKTGLSVRTIQRARKRF